jgi:hypothetical protein
MGILGWAAFGLVLVAHHEERHVDILLRRYEATGSPPGSSTATANEFIIGR